MAGRFHFITICCLAGTVLSGVLFYCLGQGFFLSLAITLGTVSYHLGIRLLVGALVQAVVKNRVDYTKKWYQLRPWEHKLYKALHVKAWKDKMPTYDPAAFSVKQHSWYEIAQAMCQSELVHELNALLSFAPLAASRWFGAFGVFLTTSLCGAAFDLLFVVIQRYNRERVLKIAAHRQD